MTKGSEQKKDEIRKEIFCEKCNSHFVYVLADGTCVCRRCGNRGNLKNKND